MLPITGEGPLQPNTSRQCWTFVHEISQVTRNGTQTIPRLAAVSITFTEEDYHAAVYPHGDTFIISANINGTEVLRILVDNGSVSNLLFVSAFESTGLLRTQLRQTGSPLRGFSGKAVEALGHIELSITFGLDLLPERRT